MHKHASGLGLAHTYRVNKHDSYIVMGQLSPEFMAELVDRWLFLEDENHGLKLEIAEIKQLVLGLTQARTEKENTTYTPPTPDLKVGGRGRPVKRWHVEQIKVKEGLLQNYHEFDLFGLGYNN
ncbi:MAG: hypothetical protein ACI8PB_002041 [Desulforhopalus sp.]|jgi:hypothetical protein